MKTPPFDVAVAVWNEFHAPELCEGLEASGLRTLALRNHFKPIPGVRTRASILSHIIQRLVAHGGGLSSQLLEMTQDVFEAHARRNAKKARIFWGWNGHSLSAFEKARENGAIVICERGSTHAAWAARRLDEVYCDLGWGDTDHSNSMRHQKALKEYDTADWISIPSEFVKKTFLEEGVEESRLFVNPYGVDVEHWCKVSGSQRGQGPLVFVFTASVTPRKGVHILLKAWEKAKLKDAELWLCGGVHFPIKHLGLPVPDTVKFLGHQDHQNIAKIYNRSSIYVLPSFEEGMARSGLEAFAAGLPLIITEETGLTDVISPGRHGWMVKAGDEESLVDALRVASNSRHHLCSMAEDCQAVGRHLSKKAYGERAGDFTTSIIGRI